MFPGRQNPFSGPPDRNHRPEDRQPRDRRQAALVGAHNADQSRRGVKEFALTESVCDPEKESPDWRPFIFIMDK